MVKARFSDMNCSLARTLGVVGDAWSLLILRDVWLGVTRFDDMVRNLGVSRNLLAERLKVLTTAGILEASTYCEKPPRRDYRLSPAGEELVAPLLALMAWGDRWITASGNEPMHVRHAGCGCRFEPVIACSACGEPVTSATTNAEPGPGGSNAPGTTVIAERFAAARN